MGLACGAEELGLGCEVMGSEGISRNINSRKSCQKTLWPGDIVTCDQLAFSKENDWGPQADSLIFFRNQLRKKSYFFLPLYDLKAIRTPSLDMSYIIHLFFIVD